MALIIFFMALFTFKQKAIKGRLVMFSRNTIDYLIETALSKIQNFSTGVVYPVISSNAKLIAFAIYLTVKIRIKKTFRILVLVTYSEVCIISLACTQSNHPPP